MSERRERRSGAVVLATQAPGVRDGLAHAASVGVAAVRSGGDPGAAAVLATLESEPRRRPPTLLASSGARRLEADLRAAGWDGAVARGHLCVLAIPVEPEPLPELARLRGLAGTEQPFCTVLHVPPEIWTDGLDRLAPVSGGLFCARLPRDRALSGLVAADLHRRGSRARVATRPLGRVASRRALAGIDPGGVAASRAARLAAGLMRSDRGQAMPAVLGAAAAVITAALVLVTIVGAMTGAGRAQRSADLAAISAARSMRDDLPRLTAPARLPNGLSNPRHLGKAEFLRRAADAAREVAARNGVAAGRVRIRFPGRAQPVPVRATVRVRGELESVAAARPVPVIASATAEAAPPAGWTGLPVQASGGGYSGPLVYRQAEGMRPDVGLAFDQMAAAARRAGILLTVSSGFRSDAEQAALFAAHPDPTWVARPGTSLHRCATELDLGPASAYGWLAANASRFGFQRRYSWEPWHFGYVRGPAPCSSAGNSAGGADGLTQANAAAGVPSFVPGRYREPLRRSAVRWNVSAALLAAQIEAESGFNPNAVSPAGAQGLAQFMPGTAASYGLRNPFDPEAAIDAQAHLMSDLLRQFRSVPLALAAYNAGAGAVGACDCVPYAETRAYVARILALLNGAGALISPPLEVRLVE